MIIFPTNRPIFCNQNHTNQRFLRQSPSYCFVIIHRTNPKANITLSGKKRRLLLKGTGNKKEKKSNANKMEGIYIKNFEQ